VVGEQTSSLTTHTPPTPEPITILLRCTFGEELIRCDISTATKEFGAPVENNLSGRLYEESSETNVHIASGSAVCEGYVQSLPRELSG